MEIVLLGICARGKVNWIERITATFGADKFWQKLLMTVMEELQKSVHCGFEFGYHHDVFVFLCVCVCVCVCVCACAVG
jgi:hypothetical protein